MEKELSKVYEPKKVEEKIYKLWEKSGFFNPDKLATRKKQQATSYTIVLPPPNITGSLHMGHALNAIVQDILIRKKRMEGFQTLWLPGTDHAGIATQNVVEKELKKEGLTRQDLGREKFIKRVWQWQEKYGNIILEQLKKLGASCDWSRTRFTLDKDYCQAINHAFSYYFKKGWIYRGNRVINWCPRCGSSLSDLEVEYKEKKGHLWYIKYPLKKNHKSQITNHKQIPNYIMVATTRPETMLGDTAVAVNPQDKRYKNLIGEIVILPILGREIPIISDKNVDPKFGSGAVKITPAHDFLDWEIAQTHKLPLIPVIDKNRKMTKETGKLCQGLKVSDCRQKVIEELKKQKLLEKIEDYNHQIPHCFRCGTIIEPLISEQWFLKMKNLAPKARMAVKKKEIIFTPKRWEKIYFDWISNIKDWCISRQIWWGHRMPIWRCQIGSKLKVKSSRLKVNEEYFVSVKKPKRCPICGKCNPEQVEDVLDTWFSSALWPFATLGWPKKRKAKSEKRKTDLEKFYPTDVLSTAPEIINLWVARMIFSGLEFMKKTPFKKVYIHPVVLTREGKRMSKSLETGVDPLDLIEKYGADATRFGLIYQIMGGQDIRFVEDHIIMGKKFCNKIWNASRFVLEQIGKPQNPNHKSQTNPKTQIPNLKQLTKADRLILKKLEDIIKSVNKDLENFRFGQASHTLYDFFWHDLCDKYIEQFKRQETRDKKEEVLLYVLLTSLKLLHPFIPFATEEIYQKLPIKNKGLLITEVWQ